jgi:hypothetical protein
MTGGRRFALLAAVVVIAVAGFIILKPDSGSKDQSSPPTTASTTAGGGGSAKPDKPAIPNIVVKNAKPVGGVQQLKFAKGDTVQFKVTSDVADEVHVHGYNLMKDVAPGKPVTFKFKANIDGEFEAELENRKEQIIALEVTP